jgi:hypothetical protein
MNPHLPPCVCCVLCVPPPTACVCVCACVRACVMSLPNPHPTIPTDGQTMSWGRGSCCLHL